MVTSGSGHIGQGSLAARFQQILAGYRIDRHLAAGHDRHLVL